MSGRTELQKARAAHKRAHARLAVLWKPIPKARERCVAALERLKRAERAATFDDCVEVCGATLVVKEPQ